MGRYAYSDRWTVEQCTSINTKFLNDHNFFNGKVRNGVLTWSVNKRETGCVRIEVSTTPGDQFIRFQYTHTDRRSNEKNDLDYKARLEWTSCYFGGRRWWFICPLGTDDGACNRRVGALHLANGIYFGCRHCYDLTYRSCKENHQGDSILKRSGIDPKGFREFLKIKNRKR
jgi:hypothetical protein